MATECVLDASAILAFVKHEPGRDAVAALIADGAVSSINFAEVVSNLWNAGIASNDISELIDALPLNVVAADRELAIDIGALRPLTRAAGLSLGDRACLALGRRLGLPIYTCDRAWSKVDLPGIVIHQIR